MQPCNQKELLPEGRINCERCEKCVRTKLSLLVLDQLDQPTAFSARNVTAPEIDALTLRDSVKIDLLENHVSALRRLGRRDLVGAVERKVSESRRRLRWRRRRQRLVSWHW